MAEKEQQPSHPLAPAYVYPRSNDTEAATTGAAAPDSRELRKKKRMKCALYIILFAIFQIGVITIFTLTIMKYRTPKFRIREAALTNFNAGAPANPSLRATLNAEFSVKNANFGRYKYKDTTVEFFYGGAKVGEAFVPKSKAGWRSTKKVRPNAVDLNIGSSTQLGSDMSAGVVRITSSAKMSGKVELMFIMKKNRAANMNCTIDIVTATQSIENIVCR